MNGVIVAQVLLIVLIAALGIYVFALRTVSTDRLAMLAVAVAGGLLVAWPGLSTDVAKVVGIGRGTDLVFYLFIIFCLFRFVSTAASMRRLEARFTRVVREAALNSARPAPARHDAKTGLLADGDYGHDSHAQGPTAE
jgi:hypothetical protein